jgi:type I restriction enzyme, S subunit
MLTYHHDTVIGNIPEDWHSRLLRELIKEQFSGDWGADEGACAVSVLRSTNFTSSGALDFSDVATRYFNQVKADTFVLKKGDILVERSGGGPDQPVGRTGFITEDLQGYTVSNFVQVLRPDTEKIDPDFLGWVLYELQRTGIVERVQQQSTQMRNLNWRDYQRLMLPWPELDEQGRIASTLKLVDDAIVKFISELKATRNLKRSLEGSLLTGDLDGKKRPKRKTKVGELPNDWNVVQLKTVGFIDSGVTLNQDRAPKYNPCRYLTVAHVQRGVVTSNDPRYLELSECERETRLLAPFDVLVVEGHANSMEIGRAAIFQGLGEPTTFQNHLFRIRPDVQQLLPRFLFYVLNSERVQRHWNAICNTSSGLNTINRRNLRNLLIQFPEVTEQKDILDILDAGDRSVIACEQKLISLQQLKKSLLQNLLTGKIRIPEGAIHE